MCINLPLSCYHRCAHWYWHFCWHNTPISCHAQWSVDHTFHHVQFSSNACQHMFHMHVNTSCVFPQHTHTTHSHTCHTPPHNHTHTHTYQHTHTQHTHTQPHPHTYNTPTTHTQPHLYTHTHTHIPTHTQQTRQPPPPTHTHTAPEHTDMTCTSGYVPCTRRSKPSRRGAASPKRRTTRGQGPDPRAATSSAPRQLWQCRHLPRLLVR